MPNNLVKTKKDEKLWDRAKQIASDRGFSESEDDFWAYTVGVYKRMRGGRTKSESAIIQSARGIINERTSIH